MHQRHVLTAALGSGILAVVLLAPAAEPPQAVETASAYPATQPPLRQLEPSTTTTHPPSTTTQPPTTTTQPPPPTTAPPVVDESPPEVAEPPPQTDGDGCGGWRTTIAAHFPAEQVPKACQVMLCESGGSPTATNPSGASGLFQVMPSWADEYQAVTGKPYYDGRFDGGANTAFAGWLWAEGGWGHWSCA